MFWKRSSVLVLTGTAFVASGFICTTSQDETSAPQPPLTQNAQTHETIVDRDVSPVVYQETSERIQDYVNNLRSMPPKDEATAASDTSLPEYAPQLPEAPTKVELVESYEEQESNWSLNPLVDQPIREAAATEQEVIQIRTAPRVKKEASPQPKPRLQTYLSISDSVAQKAAHSIEYGKSLARRGSAYSARHEFLRALRVIAQSVDSQRGTGGQYTEALNRAVLATREAEDFYIADSESQIALNAAHVVETHRSRIVTIEQAKRMPALEVLQNYFAYAEQQLSIACGCNAVSSEALYCLGKLHTVMAKHDPNPKRMDLAKSIMFHRAALQASQDNFRSANELGTLLAQNGQMAGAKKLLLQSLETRQTPQAWANLAVVHERLGEQGMANLARKEYMINAQQPIQQTSMNSIRWVSPEEFNQGTPMDFQESAARIPTTPAGNRMAERPSEKENNQKWIDRVKDRVQDKVKKLF